MTSTPTLATEVMVPALRELSRFGPDVERRARQGFGDLLADRIPRTRAAALLENAVLVSGDAAFPLRAGSAIRRGDLGLVHMLAGSAPTLRASILLAAQYLPLLDDAATFELTETNEVAIWKHRPAPGVKASVAASEYLVSASYFAAQELVGVNPRALEVWMMHDHTSHDLVYGRLFGAPARFGCDHNAIVLPRAALDLPLVTADAPLLRVLERSAGEKLSRVVRTPPFLARVRAVLAGRLATGATVVELAGALHMSESTLQRRLRSLGTTHTTVLDDARRERALELLADRALNVSEIAFQLGFAHRPAFYRAFKRWYGHSPTEHRRE